MIKSYIINKGKAQLHACISANVTFSILHSVYVYIDYLTRVQKQNVITCTDT